MSRSVVPAIESPCPKEWSEMQGDGKCRFCEHCQLHVHNLSAMTGKEQRELFAKAEGRVCVAYDESVSRPVTAGLWRWWQRLTLPLRAALAAASAFVPMLSSCSTTPKPAASGPMVRDLQKRVDGSVTLGRVKVGEVPTQAQTKDVKPDAKNMMVGMMPPMPTPWWKRLLHLE